MAESDSGEKTEEATSKKLEDTRAEGQVAKSAEFTTAAFLLGATLTLSMIGPMVWRMLLDTMGESLSTVGDPERGGIAAITWLLTSLNKWEILSTIIFIGIICLIYFAMKWMKIKKVKAAI